MTRAGWLVVVLAACSDGRAPAARPDATVARAAPSIPDARLEAAPDARAPLTTTVLGTCLDVAVEGTITIDQDYVHYCQSDATCAIWDRKTKDLRVQGSYTVEKVPTTEVELPLQPTPPEDTEVTFLDDAGVQLCPPKRACTKLYPGVKSPELRYVVLSPDDTIAALVIDPPGARVELWSVAKARRVAKIPARYPGKDVAFRVEAEFVPGGVVVYAIADEDEFATATLHDLKGKRRVALANGSELVDYDNTYMLDDHRLAVFDYDEEDKPYRLVVHDVRSGKILGRYPIPYIDQSDDNTFVIDRFESAIVVTEQWKGTLRVDVIDPRPKRGVHEFYEAPGCGGSRE